MQTRTRGWLVAFARLAAFLSLALFLCGCTGPLEYVRNGFKVGPNYRRPPAPVAPDWIDAADERVRSQSEPPALWWNVFNDPVLNSLVQNASQENLSLREAGFRVLQARAQRAIAVGSLFPQTQQATGTYQRIQISSQNVNIPVGLPRFFSLWDGGFNLAWEIDFWGRFRRAVESADARLDASVENYDDVLVTLLGDTASTYVQIRTLQQRIVLAQANVALQRETLKIAEAKFKGGQTSELDVDQAKSTLAQTEALIPTLEISLRQANNELCTLLGIPPRDLLPEIGPAPIPAAPVAAAVGIPAELLTRRPDVRRAERDLAAQSAQIGIATAELYPQIAVTGQIGVQASDLDELFTPRSVRAAIGPSITWNILNYGRLVNNIRVQDARFQELVASYQNTVLNASQEVEDGLAVFLRSQQIARHLAESVDATARAVKIVLVQYREGRVDFNRVVLVEQNLVQQQDQLAQAQGNIALGLIQVYRALGGGWQIRCGPEGVVESSPPMPRADDAGDPKEILPAPRPGPK